MSWFCPGCLGPGATHEVEKLLARCVCGRGKLENLLGSALSPLRAWPCCRVALGEGGRACTRLEMRTSSCGNHTRKDPSLGDTCPLSSLPWIACLCAGVEGYPGPPPTASSLFCNQIAFCLGDVCTCVPVCLCTVYVVPCMFSEGLVPENTPPPHPHPLLLTPNPHFCS